MDTSTAQGNVEMHNNVTEELISARRLWIAVILNAVEDWRNGTLRARREAQEFLFDNDGTPVLDEELYELTSSGIIRVE